MLRLEEEDIYAGIATSGSGGGDSSALRIIHSFGMCEVDNGVYSVLWQIEKPELQYDEYYSRFTVEQGSNGKYSFIAVDTTKDGKVVGLPHFVGWLTLFTGAMSTPFVLPEFDYDAESDEYSAMVEGYSLNFRIEIDPEVETSANFVCGTITKDGLEVGDWNLGLWNEELPLSKGSFDSTTQQLTLNYDYLVEMINSSTATTAEQKSAMIALLNNQSPVINMATDIAVENSYIYGFMATSEIPVGLQVDKATPCTLKIMFDGESIGGIGSYQAIANYMTQISGETTTPEMVEAMFGPSIVDENLCTVSGTLGNFSVEFN